MIRWARRFGSRQRVLAVGMGGGYIQCANPQTFNTTVVDPELFDTYEPGDADDPNYYVQNLHPHNEFNGRSLMIFLPRTWSFTPRALDRLAAAARELKPLTVNIRVKSIRGPLRAELLDDTVEVPEP